MKLIVIISILIFGSLTILSLPVHAICGPVEEQDRVEVYEAYQILDHNFKSLEIQEIPGTTYELPLCGPGYYSYLNGFSSSSDSLIMPVSNQDSYANENPFGIYEFKEYQLKNEALIEKSDISFPSSINIEQVQYSYQSFHHNYHIYTSFNSESLANFMSENNSKLSFILRDVYTAEQNQIEISNIYDIVTPYMLFDEAIPLISSVDPFRFTLIDATLDFNANYIYMAVTIEFFTLNRVESFIFQYNIDNGNLEIVFQGKVDKIYPPYSNDLLYYSYHNFTHSHLKMLQLFDNSSVFLGSSPMNLKNYGSGYSNYDYNPYSYYKYSRVYDFGNHAYYLDWSQQLFRIDENRLDSLGKYDIATMSPENIIRHVYLGKSSSLYYFLVLPVGIIALFTIRKLRMKSKKSSK